MAQRRCRRRGPSLDAKSDQNHRGPGKERTTIGTNRRYSEYYDRQMDGKILQRIAEENPLQSLTPEERQEDTLPVTRDPKPKPCKAWVRFGQHAMLVDAVVVVWNDIACGIQFTAGNRELRCWVWANAVTPVR